jgi:hypothetical protein
MLSSLLRGLFIKEREETVLAEVLGVVVAMGMVVMCDLTAAWRDSVGFSLFEH